MQNSPPQHHDTRRHKHAPLPPESPQKKGADSGHLVWVRVNKSGKLASNSERDDSEGELEGSYWWPACVRKFSIPRLGPNRLMCTGYRGTVDRRTPHRLSLWRNLARCGKERPDSVALAFSCSFVQAAGPGYHTFQFDHVQVSRTRLSTSFPFQASENCLG